MEILYSTDWYGDITTLGKIVENGQPIKDSWTVDLSHQNLECLGRENCNDQRF